MSDSEYLMTIGNRGSRVRIPEEYHPPARLDIVGGGVIGRMAAHLALDSPYFRDNIHVYDTHPVDAAENASVTSLAQVLPLATEGDERHQKKQFEIITPLMKESFAFYRKLAQWPDETGVKEAYLVELVKREDDWPEQLVRIMRPVFRKLDRPVELTGPDGQKETYGHCYVRPSAHTVHGATFLNYLSKDGQRWGVKEHVETIRPADLWRLSQLGGVTLQAAGIGASDLSGERFVEDWGASIRNPDYKVNTLDGGAVMRSVNDIALSATAKGLVGGGGMWNHRPNRRELDFHKYRLKELGRAALDIVDLDGPIEPIAESALRKMDDLKVHPRPTSEAGIYIGKAYNVPYGIIATGFGHVGMSVAPGAAREIVWRAEEQQQERWDRECTNVRCDHGILRYGYLKNRQQFQKFYPDYNWD